jgi:hypothetical protein
MMQDLNLARKLMRRYKPFIAQKQTTTTASDESDGIKDNKRPHIICRALI